MRLAAEMASRKVEISPKTVFRIGIFIFLWLTLILAGFYFVQSYNSRPGDPASPPVKWPQNDILPFTPGQPMLLVFLHPMCPCSNATMKELKAMLAIPGNTIHPVFVMMTPEDADPSWKNSFLVRSALETPNAKALFSQSAALEKLFSVHTSGQVLFYDGDGRLLFSGGITPARGEQGENAGAFQLKKLLSGSSLPSVAQSTVFGCPLASETPTKDKP